MARSQNASSDLPDNHHTEHYGRHDNLGNPKPVDMDPAALFDGVRDEKRVQLHARTVVMPNSKIVKLSMVPYNMLPADTTLEDRLFSTSEEGDEQLPQVIEDDESPSEFTPVIIGSQDAPSTTVLALIHTPDFACVATIPRAEEMFIPPRLEVEIIPPLPADLVVLNNLPHFSPTHTCIGTPKARFTRAPKFLRKIRLAYQRRKQKKSREK